MDSGLITEHGVTVTLSTSLRDALGSKNLQKRCQLGFSRSFALWSLSGLNKKINGQIGVLDISGGVGLAGIQWLKHLDTDVQVTINAPHGLKQHVDACLKENKCPLDNVNVVSEDAHVVMHSGKYMFIYAEVYGSAVTYFDSIFRSINHNGLVCVTSTDTSILQNKSPATAHRLYGSNVWKTEYCTEMALRVVIGSMARAAARWNKGIIVELCMGHEHGLTVICRVMKGSKFGEKSVSSLKYVAHCQLCQARKLLPDKIYLCDKPEETKVCECGGDGLSAPVIMLGPMWGGGIFNSEFLTEIFFEMYRFGCTQSYVKLLKALLIESVCCESEEMEHNILREIDGIITSKNVVQANEQDMPPEKRRRLENTLPRKFSKDETNALLVNNNLTANHALTSALNVPTSLSCPEFYFDIQQHSVKGGNPPTLVSVIKELRALGHQASKTHFGPRCVRTSATLKIFSETLQKIWNNTRIKKHDGV